MRFPLLVFAFVGLTLGLSAAQLRTHITTGGTLPTNCTVGDVWYKTGASAGFYACSATDTWTGVSSGGTALSAITAASGSNTIASGNNSGQVWNWALTSNSVTAFAFGETTAATNGTANNQVILGINTLANSTATPFYIKNYGNADSLRIDDVSGDTTPLLVDAAGNLCLLCSTQNASYPLFINKNGFAFAVSDGTSTFEIYNSATIGGIGTATNHPFNLYVNSGQPRVKVFTTGVTELWRRANPPTSIGTGTTGLTNEYLHIGGSEFTTNGYFLIGFGYAASTVPPTFIGYQEISSAGNSKGDVVFGTRDVTTDTAPTERMRILADGTVNVLDLKTTGSATGKNVVCVDTATGKLYASSTGTDCSN